MKFNLPENVHISVVIPNYNRSHELLRAVKSALAQTLAVHEILVCDDGSSDNSKQLIEELNHPKVKWIDCGKNGGPAAPRNIGVEKSSGNYIAFLDSDDEWLPVKLEKQLKCMQTLKLPLSCTNAFRMVNEENKGAYLSYDKDRITLIDFMRQNSVICSTVVIEKDFLVNTSLFPTDKHLVAFEDNALWLRLASQSDLAFVNECLIYYKDDSQTSIRNKWQFDSWDVFGVVFTDFKKWASKKGINFTPLQKKELKRLFGRIKRKGAASDWEKMKLNIKKIIGKA
jgi:teichuronic acid biosynthesis glycosyltransferase TuaG